jgi:hypothetical protein
MRLPAGYPAGWRLMAAGPSPTGNLGLADASHPIGPVHRIRPDAACTYERRTGCDIYVASAASQPVRHDDLMVPATPAVRGELSPETTSVVAVAGVTTMPVCSPVI